MHMKLFLAVVAAAAVSAGGALAAGTAGRAEGKIVYSFLGRLTSAPNDGRISIGVAGGNRPALRAMLGETVAQTFAYGDDTEFLKWSQGVPAVVEPGQLAAGDFVRVHVRAERGATLGQIEQSDAVLVGDRGAELSKPTQPAYVFRGKLTAVGSSSISVDVRGGNRRAMRLLIGEPAAQTFTVGGSTIFIRWQGRVPTVISRADLKVGDAVVVRIRAEAGSSLGEVEAKAAVHVGEHEPPSTS
jgi:hypothetical protein